MRNWTADEVAEVDERESKFSSIATRIETPEYPALRGARIVCLDVRAPVSK